MMKQSANVRGHGGANNYSKDCRQVREKGPKQVKETRRADEFDLVTETKRSQLFKVVFDYYTPRAHFVILPRDGCKLKARDYDELQEIHKLDFVHTAKAMVDEYNLDGNSVLSVHRGSWLSNKDIFHASVCVGVDQYIDVLRLKEQQIPDWPGRQYVTKEWRASKNPRDFEKNIKGYPFKTYHSDELKSIEEFITKGMAKLAINPPTTYEGYTLLYHSSEPRVGFAVEKSSYEDSAACFVKTLDVLSKFAGENGLTDLKGSGDDKGCHMCLVLGRCDHGFQIDSRQALRGYIQTSGSKFYSGFCSVDMKEKWLKRFESHRNYKVYT